jgi:hypothetical protein
MNERLLGFVLEFAAQAEEYADVEYAKRQTGYTRQDFFNYKLVQLTVRQCAEICLEANDHDNILRYFGVDE